MAQTKLNMTLLLRRDNFTANSVNDRAGHPNYVLQEGEPGYCQVEKVFKVGDGATAWKDLPFANQAQIEALIAAGIAEAKEYAVASVSKETGTAITVDNTDSKNPKIGLDINNTGNVILSQTDAGLSANIDLNSYELTDTTYTFSNGTEDGTFVVTPEGGNAQTIKIGGMTAAEALAEAKQYADTNDANTAHNHVDGIGIKASGGDISGDAKLDLNVAFDFIKSGDTITKVVLYDKDDTSKAEIASFETSAFIKDGMLHDVKYDAATNELTFTWNTDAGTKTDKVTLTDILDPYVFEAGVKLDVAIDGTKVTYSHETVAAPAESAGTGRKYLTGVTTDGYGHITGFTTATEVDQDLTNYKVTQTPVGDPGTDGKTLAFIDSISQNAQGVITATKKAVDLDNYYTKDEADAADDNTTYEFAATTIPLQFTVTPSEGDPQTVTLVAPTVDTGVMSIEAGKDIVVTPGENGKVTIDHADIKDAGGNIVTGTIKDAAHDSATDPSFITGITVANGHVTGATVRNLASVLEAMEFILDGGNAETV